MARRSVVVLASLLVVGTALSGTGPVQSASATSCAIDRVSNLERGPDGHWYVQENVQTVKEYTADFESVENRSFEDRLRGTGEDLPSTERNLVAMTSGPDGHVWVLTAAHEVVALDTDWEYAGEWHPVNLSGVPGRPADVEYTDDRWLLVTTRAVAVYDRSWRRQAVTTEDAEGRFQGVMTAGDGTIASLGRASSEMEGRVYTYSLEANGTLEYRNGSDVPGLEHPTTIVDLHRGTAENWWLLREDGTVVEYTEDWEQTGQRMDIAAEHDSCAGAGWGWIAYFLLILAAGLILSVFAPVLLALIYVVSHRRGLAVPYLGFAVFGTLVSSLVIFEVSQFADGFFRSVLVLTPLAELYVISDAQDTVTVMDRLALVAINTPVFVGLLYPFT